MAGGDEEILQIHDEDDDEDSLDTGEPEGPVMRLPGLRVSIGENSGGRRVVIPTPTDVADTTMISDSDVFDSAILPSLDPEANGFASDSASTTAAMVGSYGSSSNGHSHAGASRSGRFPSDPISAELYVDVARQLSEDDPDFFQRELVALEEQFKQINENGHNISDFPGEQQASEGSESEDSSSDSTSESGESGSEAGEEDQQADGPTGVSSSQVRKPKVPILPPDTDKSAASAKRRRSPTFVAPKDSHAKKSRDNRGERTSPSTKSKDLAPEEGDPRLKELLKDARFFLIKSGNCENVSLSKAKGVWATTPLNERTLNSRFRDTPNVILVFSVEKSGSFQGFARLCSESDRTRTHVNWVLPPGMNPHSLGGVFDVQWLCRNELSFLRTYHLQNALNEYKSVKIGRDGTEIERTVGEQLCNMFAPDYNLNFEDLLGRIKKAERPKTSPNPSPNKGKRYSDSRRRTDPPAVERREHDRPRHRVGRNSDWEDLRSRPPVSGSNATEYGGGRSAYGGVSRDTIMNGDYTDYIREYSIAGPAGYLSSYSAAYVGGYPAASNLPASQLHFDYPYGYSSTYGTGQPYGLLGGTSDRHSSGRYASHGMPMMSTKPKYDDRVAAFMDRVTERRAGDRRSDRDRKSDRPTRERPPVAREESRHRRHRHSRLASPRRPHSIKRSHVSSNGGGGVDAARLSHRRKSDSRRH